MAKQYVQGDIRHLEMEDASSVELPEGVNRDLWVGYIEMRFSMNKKPTPKAVELAIKDLAKWGAEKANQSLKNSITSNWTGLFEPKEAVQSYSNARNDREAAWADYYRNREQQNAPVLVDVQGVTHG